MRKKNLKSFTLIELLVVIAVIGLLASITLVSLKVVLAKSRDARRITEMNQLRAVLEIYYNTYHEYPPNNTDNNTDIGCWWLWDAGNLVNGPNDPFIQPLSNVGAINIPREWTDITDEWGTQCTYRYVRQDSPICGCSQKYAVLYAALETNSTAPARTDERPDCIKRCWAEGAAGYDYAIYLPW